MSLLDKVFKKKPDEFPGETPRPQGKAVIIQLDPPESNLPEIYDETSEQSPFD